ncbi:hypothetical protein DA075_29380 [Methylobacterium currus]|uniref:Uncharacterized protein n=1 Tax=Methylobacterium currus TaxID=2051553 RepID=A0A2R4WSI3_9HYPH|nr:hypothetical protein DA075_29380 [Methylobacterium currus]
MGARDSEPRREGRSEPGFHPVLGEPHQHPGKPGRRALMRVPASLPERRIGHALDELARGDQRGVAREPGAEPTCRVHGVQMAGDLVMGVGPASNVAVNEQRRPLDSPD